MGEKFPPGGTFFHLFRCLLLFSYIEGDFKEEVKEFIEALERINEKAPYRTKNVPNRTRGSNILSRLIAISNHKKQLEEKEWSREEIFAIRQLPLTKSLIFSQENYDRFKCTEEQLKIIVNIQIIELSKREFTYEEDKIIISYISTTIKNKDLVQFFLSRTANDIKKRRTALKKLLQKNPKVTK